MSKKGGDSGSGSYDYYGTIAAVVCAGPVDELLAIICDSQVVWPVASDFDVAKSYALNELAKYSGRVWVWNNATPSVAGTTPPASSWIIYSVSRVGNPNPFPITIEKRGKAYFYWGTTTQALDTVDEKTLNDNNHPPYRRQAVIVLKDFLFGRERNNTPNLEVVVRRKPVQSVITGAADAIDGDGQANPIGALIELQTDSVFGAGLDSADIDATTAQSIANDLQANAAKTYISPLVTSPQSVREFITKLFGYYDGWARYNASAKLEFGRYSHNDSIPTFTAATTIYFHDLTDEISYDSNLMNDTVNEVHVRFNDSLRAFKSASVKAVANYNRQLLQEPISENIEREWITRRQQASDLASETVKIHAQSNLSGTLRVRAEKCDSIRPGTLFLLTHDALGISLIVRCVSKTIPKPPSGSVSMKFELERGLSPVPYQPTPSTGVTPDLVQPKQVELYMLCQLPPKLTGINDFVLTVLAARKNQTDLGLNVHFRTTSKTASRARASNVATITTTTAHGLSTGTTVQIFGLGGTGYNTSSTTVTVLSTTTFTYANTGGDEATTTDTGGTIYTPGASFDMIGGQSRFAVNATLHADYLALSQKTTSSRARTSNVATIITSTAHGLSTGMEVQVLGLGGTGYNTTSAVITVVTSTKFTYPSTGANEGTTADTGGTVDPLDDDDSESFQIDLVAGTVQSDLDLILADQSKDMIENDETIIIAFAGGDPNNFEILTLKAIRFSAVYKLKVRRSRFGTPRLDIMSGDPIWIIQRAALSAYEHTSFETMTTGGLTGTFRLQAFNYYKTADVSDTTVCPNIDYIFGPGYAPQVTWKALTANGTAITVLTGSYLTTDKFEFTFEITDANKDLLVASLVARRGSSQIVLWSHPLTQGIKTTSVTVRFSIPDVGAWQIFAVVRDLAGRVTEEELNLVGGSTKYPVLINTGGGTTEPTPTALPAGQTKMGFGTASVTLTSPTGHAIKYQITSLYTAPSGGAWATYTGPITIAGKPAGRTLWAYVTFSAPYSVDSDPVSWNFIP